MSTRATYGLLKEFHYDVPPFGARVYWAIPMDYGTSAGSRTLFSAFSQGESIGNERAVSHVKVTGHINPKPFIVDGLRYATSFSFSERKYLGNYKGVDVFGQQETRCQIYRDGARQRVTLTVDEGQEFPYHSVVARGVINWSFNGGIGSDYDWIFYESVDGGPEHMTSRQSGWTYLSKYWTGTTEEVNYNWPALVKRALGDNPCKINYNNLIVEAADQLQYSANNLDNVRQFADIAGSLVLLLTGHAPKKTLKKVLHGTKSPRAFGKELKELSQSAWLTKRYAIDTTKSDLDDFLEKVNSIDLPECKDEHIVRAGITQGHWTGHVKIRLRDRKQNALAEAHRWAMQHGFGVTPANLWDMIPFSFMVDWFIPVGDTLKSADAEFFFHSAYYEILSYTASRKFTIDVEDNGNLFHVSLYEREVSGKVPIISNLTYEDPSTRTVRNRVIDAAAIFL